MCQNVMIKKPKCAVGSVWTHPDFVVDHPVLCILVKLLLRVDVDPIGSQFFSDLYTVEHGGRRHDVRAAHQKTPS